MWWLLGALAGGALAGAPLHAALTACAAEPTAFGAKVRSALETTRAAYRLYGADGVVVSFNGGKDAVVALHVARAVLAARDPGARVRALYVENGADAFGEVDAFVHAEAVAHDLRLVQHGGLLEGTGSCVRGGARAFVLGTRATDPNAAGQGAFAPSSHWMPPFLRVNPILDWGYADVWECIDRFELPTCALYADGYTSLGARSRTARNPALRRVDGTYAHARARRPGGRALPGGRPSSVDGPLSDRDPSNLTPRRRRRRAERLRLRARRVERAARGASHAGATTRRSGSGRGASRRPRATAYRSELVARLARGLMTLTLSKARVSAATQRRVDASLPSKNLTTRSPPGRRQRVATRVCARRSGACARSSSSWSIATAPSAVTRSTSRGSRATSASSSRTSASRKTPRSVGRSAHAGAGRSGRRSDVAVHVQSAGATSATACTKPPGASHRWTETRGGVSAQVRTISASLW